MPLSFATIFRLGVLVLMIGHVFYMYCLARVMGHTFGFDVATTVFSALFAFGLLIPLVWAVGIPELPEFYTRTVRARRWWKAARCTGCGYPMRQLRGTSCPECGLADARREPSPYRLGAVPIRRFAAMGLMAWVIGCLAGETWLQVDEAGFRREVAECSINAFVKSRSRARAWPNAQFHLWYTAEGGFTAEEPIHHLRVVPMPHRPRDPHP